MLTSKHKRIVFYRFISLFFFLFFLYFIPKEIAYPKYKVVGWSVLPLIFLLLPYLLFKTVKSINQKTGLNKTLGICALSILIVGPTYGLFQKYRQEKELKTNGKTTKCIVIDRKKTKKDWLINCKYFANNTEFITYYHTDEENKYRIGDTIKLVYNKDFPRMYDLVF